ncbi:MAG: TonB-dependent receptor plug domain-containing protein, partial [Bacteroidales bacterium]|nr:TonB-dependent receptor plug domain-containing protein [Bacteroidales bacterium]
MLKKQTLILALATLLTTSLHAQHHVSVNGSVLDTLQLNEVVINSSYADGKTPLTTSEMNRDKLQEIKLLPSLPYQLELEPSVVVSGENGMVGATSFRIRGVDATRINVNINGITLNDPESQSVFWYNIPNLGGMAQSIQLQRGVGASNGGSASFGGAMSLQTFTVAPKAYGQADIAYGSFNTKQYG